MLIPHSTEIAPFRRYAKIQIGIFSLLLLCVGLGIGTSVVHANDQPIKVHWRCIKTNIEGLYPKVTFYGWN